MAGQNQKIGRVGRRKGYFPVAATKRNRKSCGRAVHVKNSGEGRPTLVFFFMGSLGKDEVSKPGEMW